MKHVVLIQLREGIFNKVLKPRAQLSLLAAEVKLD